MTLEEAQIAWLRADTDYKIYLTKRGIKQLKENKQVMREEKELEVAMPALKPTKGDLPW